MKLSRLGEFGLIDLLTKGLPKTSSQVVIGVGDDCAVLKLKAQSSRIKTNPRRQSSKLLLATTDTLIENIHFRLKSISLVDLGYKALAVNVSDIASMGGVPKFALVTIGAHKNFPVRKIKELYRGIGKLAKEYKIDIVGGDTVRSRDLVISIALLGEVEKALMLTRAGARVGDLILVTGDFGGPAGGKYALGSMQYAVRIQEARMIAKTRKATAMIDSSDGLVRSVLEICKASKVGARIKLDSVPIAKKATMDQALYGGEEYELVFTAPRRAVEFIKRKFKTKVSVVGEIVAKKQGVKLVDIHGKIKAPKSGGFEHFK